MNVSEDKNPAISILIVTYNSADDMRNCIPELLKLRNTGSVEIIVVDNASSDETLTVLNQWQDRITTVANMENRGFGPAVNQGAALSSAPYILLLNPDTQMTRMALETMHEFLEENPGVAAIGPRLEYPDGRLQPSRGSFPTLIIITAHILNLKRMMPSDDRIVNSRWNILGRYFRQYAPLTDIQDVDYTTGACVLLRKDVFTRIGGFDEDFFLYYEEIDLAARVKQAGFRWVFLDKVIVIHTVAVSSSQFPVRSFYERYRSMMIYFRKHGGWFQVRIVLLLIQMMALWKFTMLGCRRRGSKKDPGMAEMCRMLKRLRSIGGDTAGITKKTAATSNRNG